jgi:hypothetical protein
MASFIDLTNVKPFAMGRCRKCYINPLNNKECIKVAFRAKHKHHNDAEYKAIKELAERVGLSKTIPSYCDYVETNVGVGRGLKTELFYLKGKIAPNVQQYAQENPDDIELRQSLRLFFQHLEKELPFIRSMLSPNLIVTDNEVDDTCPYHIKMIDDFGAKNLIPLDKWFLWARRRCVKKRINRFYQRYPKIITR